MFPHYDTNYVASTVQSLKHVQSYLVFQIYVCLCNHAELAMLPEVGKEGRGGEKERTHTAIGAHIEV